MSTVLRVRATEWGTVLVLTDDIGRQVMYSLDRYLLAGDDATDYLLHVLGRLERDLARAVPA